MEYEKIKQLIEDMGKSKLTTLDIDFPDGTKISMKKEEKKDQEVQKEIEIKEEVLHNSPKEKNQDRCNYIKSPIVGTFYIKPSPTSEPYVEIGSRVNKGDTLCIIEAMKLMNEIESEFSGKVIDILVKDGETVEYGTPLFRIGE